MEVAARNYLQSSSPEVFVKKPNVFWAQSFAGDEAKPVHENKNISAETLEERCKDYFRSPSQWLDTKTNPRAPDFQHKTSNRPLLLNPPCAQEELRRRRLQSLPNSLSVQNGATCATSLIALENAMERTHFTDREDNEEEEAKEGEVLTSSSGNPLVIQGDTSACVSYDVLLKACAQQRDLQRGTRLHGEIVQKGFLEGNTFVSSSLVNMYAKCGALSSAQDVFDKLLIRNQVSWNALIGGYAQHGHGEVSLLLFEEMQRDGFCPDIVTFVCILKACCAMGAADKSKEMHAQIARYESQSRDVFVGTALIDMYGRFGMLTKAQEVFDKLPVRNVVSWNVLIARYLDHGHGNEALACFDRMLQEGMPPNALTFLSTLKACGSLEALDLGQEVHAVLVRGGFAEIDIVVATALAGMYVKCGAFTKAEQLFYELPVQNVVSWNTLIAGCAQYGLGEKALKLFEQMQNGGLSPNAITFTCILKACGIIEALGKGQELHDQIVRDGVHEKDISVVGALVDMYVNCGAFDEARDVCNELPQRNVVLWTELIAGYTNCERAEEALDCYEQMLVEGFSPNAVTFPFILKACGIAAAFDKGKEVHAQILKDSSLVMDTIIGTAVVDMYARFGLLEKAEEVLNMLPDRNLITWNALIAGYAQHLRSEKVLDCFKRMQLEGFFPDSVTFLSILKACGSLGVADIGQEIHAECVTNGFLEGDVALGTALVDMYARCGMLADAQDAFDELPVLDVVSWNALIAGYAQHSHQEAFRCFEQMQLLGFSPDLVTFISVLRAACNLGTVDKGLEAHSLAIKQGLIEEDMAAIIVLVDMYSNFGMLAEARIVFDKLPVRDVVLWNVLLSGYSQVGEDNIVFNLFDQMKREGKKPNSYTFTVLLNTCSHGGLICKGQVYYETMSVEYNMTPVLDHVVCIVDLLCRAGLVEKAVAAVHKTPFSDNISIWHSLLAACKRWQISELGSWASKQAVLLDGSNAAAYVSLSNIFAATGNQGIKNKTEVMQ